MIPIPNSNQGNDGEKWENKTNCLLLGLNEATSSIKTFYPILE